MANREQTLNQITNFLVTRYNHYQQAERSLETLPAEQATAIVTQPDYYEKIRYEFNVAQLTEVMGLSYSSIHWALYGAYGADIRMKRHPAELVKRGIYVTFTKPASYRYEPSLLMPATVVKVTEARPEQIKQEIAVPVVQEVEVEKECDKFHVESKELQLLIPRIANLVGFNDEDVLINDSTGDPVIALCYLSAKELEILSKATSYEYKAYDAISKVREQKP